MSLGFPVNFVRTSSLRKSIVFKLDENASSVADVRKGKLGYEHYGFQKEKDGFIVDDVEEEEQDEDEANSDLEKQKKKKRKKRESEKNYDLDEDDYELLEDNGFRRSKVESKKFKRLKKAKADDDRCPPTDGIVEDEQPEEEEDGDTGEYEDEMADFFVNEEHMDEHGQPKRTYISAATRLSWSIPKELVDHIGIHIGHTPSIYTLANTWILPLPYAQNIDANRGVRRHHTVDRTSIFVAKHGQPDSACDEGCHLSFVASAKLISLAALKL
ncbi:transcription elongation factor SPT6 [Tanacetum coccineum]